MQLSPQKLKEHITNWRLHIIVQGIGFVVIPIIMLSMANTTFSAPGNLLTVHSRNSHSDCCGRIEFWSYRCYHARWHGRRRRNSDHYRVQRGYDPKLWRR